MEQKERRFRSEAIRQLVEFALKAKSKRQSNRDRIRLLLRVYYKTNPI